jgi:ergothioneine biosynthesis protein EgtB
MTSVTYDRPSAGSPATERYRSVRELTDRLTDPLSPEDQTVQSMPDVSPTKWHRAHTSWFFETFLLEPFLPGYRAYDGQFGFLFNSYYESVGPRYARDRRGCVSRPGCGEIAAYRDYVDDHMERLLEGGLDERQSALLELGLNHEQQHQELLLMDIKHVLSSSPLDPVYKKTKRTDVIASRPSWVEHPGGLVEVGHSGDGFAYDNESPLHKQYLEPFAICDRLVTCGEWLQFIEDGGYRDPRLWLSDGWAAVCADGWTAPLYWNRERDEAWTVFTLSGRQEVDPDEPVCHVSYYEADAFAAWSGRRLPTEFEWEVVAREHPVASQLDLQGAVHPRRQTNPAFFGETWVWTSSSYLPYPGFHPAPGAVGEYNGKFMVGQQILRGGCCATPAGHIRATYRNFYPPSARWPFTGVRLAGNI